jgi:O-antigen/teichoic acid export membrane protein
MILSGNNQIQTFLVATLLGLQAAGTNAAMQVFMLPMVQSLIAVGGLALPILSYEFIQGGVPALRRKTQILGLALVGTAASYGLALWVLAVPLERALYGGKFAEFVWLIPIFAWVPVFTAVNMSFSLTLSAMQRPKHFLVSGAVTSVVACVSAVLLTYFWGLAGAAASVVLTYAAGAIAYYCLYRAWVLPLRARARADEPSRI